MMTEKDNKLAFLIPFGIPIFLILGYLTENSYIFLGCALAYYAGMIILDFTFNLADKHYPLATVTTLPENQGEKNGSNYYGFLTNLFLFLYIVVLVSGIYYAQFKQPTVVWILYAIPFSLTSGTALALCHEYMHTKYKTERVISRIVASFCFWSVHEYEHLFEHHNFNTICTNTDKSHAKLNQSVYSYIFNAFISNYRHAWKVQGEISKRNKKSFFNILDNTLLQTLLISIVAIVAIAIFVGSNGLLFFLLQGILGIFNFLLLTYAQHYGLTRRKNADNVYEPFTFMNIWSTDRFISNKMLFNVGHHGHHHLHQFCRWPNLKIITDGPLLPFGYVACAIISLIPPVWYKIMNKRVEEVFKSRDQKEK